MCASHEDEDAHHPHPYWYGRIIGIFHVLVCHIGLCLKSMEIQQVDFLWVRWLGRDLSCEGGWTRKHLHRVGFLDANDDSAFGFLDPRLVIRAVHLIPAFAHGKTTNIMGPSIARRDHDGDKDWNYFYVNL